MTRQSHCYRSLIAKAASLALGDRLREIEKMCEGQNTVSTKKLQVHLDVMRDDLRRDAIQLRRVADKIKDLESNTLCKVLK